MKNSTFLLFFFVLIGFVSCQNEAVSSHNTIEEVTAEPIEVVETEQQISRPDTIQVDKNGVSFEEYSGIYESPFNKHNISFGKVTITHIENNQLQFEINTSHELGCTGVIKAIMWVDENGFAEYQDEDCERLTFQFKDNQLVVDEDLCGYHGMRCDFAGDYVKAQ